MRYAGEKAQKTRGCVRHALYLSVSMSREDANGFTIVELLVTIVVLAIVASGIAMLFSSIQYVQAAGSYQRTATLAAQREIESLRTSNYTSLTAGQTLDFSADLAASLPGPATGKATISEPVSGVKRADVVITYKFHGQSHNVKVSSLIGEIGITK